MAVVSDGYRFIPGGDRRRRHRRSAGPPMALTARAAGRTPRSRSSIPAAVTAAYFLTLQLTSGIAWSIHLWLGAIVMSGVMELVLDEAMRGGALDSARWAAGGRIELARRSSRAPSRRYHSRPTPSRVASRACSSVDRALGSGPKGRRFESCRARQTTSVRSAAYPAGLAHEHRGFVGQPAEAVHQAAGIRRTRLFTLAFRSKSRSASPSGF